MIPIRQHFGLTRIPFAQVDPRSPYRSEDLAQVYPLLDRLLLTGGIALCVGEPGAGKTFAVDAWCQTLSPNEVAVRWVEDPGDTVSAFLRRLLRGLGIAPPWGVDTAWQRLVDGVTEHHRETAQHLVFVVDEAQHLRPEILEQLRRLTNLGRRQPLPLSFVLIAHRDFLVPLAQQHLTALRRRLRATVALGGLARREMAPYVDHHLGLAGATRPLFGEDALELLWSASRGLPRVIGTLALAALALAAGEGRTLVEASILQRAITEPEVLL